ncbi:MAG: membrane dipeptidase [Thioalkalivibrio sp.]|nr:membrane dipeptidase [Thioalkalivibrio sp.]
MAEPWILDAHLDLAWNALQWNRDLRESVHVLRVREAADTGPGRGRNTVALPELRAADVRICFATLLARVSGTPRAHVDFASAEQACAIAWGQLAYYRSLERGGHLRVLADVAGLRDHVPEASPADDVHGSASQASDVVSVPRTLQLGVVVAMEGADPILAPDDVGTWAAAGLRTLGLAHYGFGRYAGGTGTGSGLTDLGRSVLPLMREVGLALDLTHLADTGFWQAIELFDGPVHVSHGNCRTLVPNQRQFGDDQIRAVADRGGVIGIALDAWMLAPGWVKGHSRRDDIGLERVVDHVDHVCTLLGDTRHVGIGSDLDGGFGTEQSPEGLETVADLRRLEGMLARRGYTTDDIANVLHGNWLRWLHTWLGTDAS